MPVSAGKRDRHSWGTSRPTVAAHPASLTTTGARTMRPPARRTPAARPSSTTTCSTSAATATCPPAASMTGRMVAAMRLDPPTG